MKIINKKRKLEMTEVVNINTNGNTWINKRKTRFMVQRETRLISIYCQQKILQSNMTTEAPVIFVE